MPELPEVEGFRQILLSLVSTSKRKKLLKITSVTENPCKQFLSNDDVAALTENCFVADVMRKGKLVCMVLDCVKAVQGQKRVYIFIHFGMTGRVSSPTKILSLESLKDSEDYPPPHTHFIFSISNSENGKNEAEVAFSDPRRFGSLQLLLDMEEQFGELATDGLAIDAKNKEKIIAVLAEQSSGIKTILLDQKRAVSGVGNWVADEVLYQSELHPDQKYLSTEQASIILDNLSNILATAVQCLSENQNFPQDWIFNFRWQKKRVGVKDAQERAIAFVKSAGRTSVIVPSIQKKRAQQPSSKTKKDSVAENQKHSERQGLKRKTWST
jgi:formamidopyrimidine-DNA glycosylase